MSSFPLDRSTGEFPVVRGARPSRPGHPTPVRGVPRTHGDPGVGAAVLGERPELKGLTGRALAAIAGRNGAETRNPATRAIVICAHGAAGLAVRHPAVDGASDLERAATYELGPAGTSPGRVIRELSALVRQHDAHLLVLVARVDADTLQALVDTAVVTGSELLSVVPTVHAAGVRRTMTWRGGHPAGRLVPKQALAPRDLLGKRLFDLALGGAAFLAASPVIAAAAVAVMIDSRGNPFFAQERLGVNGRHFRCFKLRTMRVGAHAELEQDPALLERSAKANYKGLGPDDPRITRLGRLLRRFSIDELPQLWNVVRGDMSLIGPRPIVPRESEEYGERTALLLRLRPGLTGAWAVAGRSEIGYPERADIELHYVRSWSPAKDVGILLRTIPAVLTGKGAV